MKVFICLLRGVNVGGHNKIKMEGLRKLFESLDLVNPRTHIQSGNVIFGANIRHFPTLASRIETAIEQTHQVRSQVILRTISDWTRVIERNPFAARPDVPPNKLLVSFLSAPPGQEVHDSIRKLQGGPEELHLDGSELYIYFPNGMGGSKLPPYAIDKALKTPATARNWNTVTKLLELARNWKAIS